MCSRRRRAHPTPPVRSPQRVARRAALAAGAAVAFAVPGFSAQPRQTPTPERPLVLRDVTVIAATDAPPAPRRVVLIERGRIRAILPLAGFRAPPGAEVVDGRGKFLIPGLWDMHVHVSGGPAGRLGSRYFLPLFVGYGVTGVRDMSGRLDQLLAWRDSVRGGQLVGPRMVITGFKLGSQPVVPGAPFPIKSAADVEASIRALRQGGADFVKLETVPLALLPVAVQRARAHGMDLVGHVPDAVTLAQASAAGMRSVDHLAGALLGASREEREIRRRIEGQLSWWRRLAYRLGLSSLDAVRLEIQQAILRTQDAARADSLLALLARNRTWQVPTLSGIRDVMRIKEAEPFAEERDVYQPPRTSPIPPTLWDAHPDLARRLFDRQLELAGAMHRSGVPLLVGTDLPGLDRLPGYAVVEELELLVRAGLTPLAALQAATREPARFLGALDTLGTVEEGKLADLVLLDADPLQDVRHVHRVHAVVLGGRYLGPRVLDSLRASVRQVAGHWRDSLARQQRTRP